MDRTTAWSRRAAFAFGGSAMAALAIGGDRWLQHYLLVWLAVALFVWFVENRTT
jgi:hypothetical protein